MSSTHLLERLGDMAASIDARAIPKETRDRYKDALLDFLGALLAGRSTSTADIFTEVGTTLGGNGPSRVLGSSVFLSPLMAAAANAATAHALEVDDVYVDVTGWHPGATVIPAVLAVADQNGLDGESIFEGIVAGYECGARIGSVMAAEHRRRGFHSTGTIGSLAAAAGAAHALGYSGRDIGSALGLATSLASGTFGVLAGAVSAKHLHAAHAALAGVWAAALVEAGFHGPLGALESESGFYQAFAGGVSDIDAVTRPLGNPWAIERQWVKPHACCGHIFAVIDAVQAIGAREPLSLGQVSRVDVDTYKAAAVLNEPQPETPLEAQFSIPFCAALAIDERRSGGPLAPPDFEPERIRDPELRRVAKTVVVNLDESSEAAFPAKRHTTVTIVDTADNSYQHTVDYPRGMPDNPLSGSEVRAKYRALAEEAIGDRAEDVEKLVDAILEEDSWSHLLGDAIGSTGPTSGSER